MDNIRISPRTSMVQAAALAAQLECRLVCCWRGDRLVVGLERVEITNV